MKPSYFPIVSTLLLCLVLSPAARAAETPPTVDSILTKFVTASGGKAAMEKIKTRTLKADLEVMGSSSAWESSAKAPNRQRSEFTVPVMGEVIDGFDGKIAWTKNQSGIRVKEGDELAKTKRDADFYRELNLKTLYPGLVYKGSEQVDGEGVYVLESKPSATSKERFSFSTKSGLLIRQESEFESAQGKISMNIRFGDYRVFEGINYPYSLQFKMNAGGQELEFALKVKEVKHNMTIEDAKFAKPAA
jgi:zinc protease